MKTRNKKGFTIVELVIVIAVIGILTAILVPVFINLTNKANEASDNSLVKNLNTALRMEEQTAGHKKAPTLQGAIDDLENQGYLLENLQSKSGLDLLWDQEDNQFLLNKDGVAGAKYWKIVDTLPGLDQQVYSYYAGQHFSANAVANVKYGFDVGDNEDISSISYINETTEARNVSIRTNGGTLNINAPLDVVKQYGDADSVKVEAIKTSSLHVYGTIKYAEISVGRIAMETGSKVNHIHVNAKEATTTEAKPTEFDEVIIAKATDVEMPNLSRDEVEIDATNGTRVVALQEGTEEVTPTTELDYVWLTKQGIYEQIKISDSKSDAGTTWADDEGNSKETQDAAKQIANNFISETVRPTWSSTDTTRELANIENKVEVATAVAQEEAGEAWSTMTEQQKADAVAEKVEVVTDAEQAVEAQPDKEDVETGVVLFAGGTGTQKDPYLVSNRIEFENMSEIKSYSYFKWVGDPNVDASNWSSSNYLCGSFDGNGVVFNNLDCFLFRAVWNGSESWNPAEDIVNTYTIKNFTVNVNIVSDGWIAAVVRVAGVHNFVMENVTVHGYVEGATGVASFVCFGAGNYAPESWTYDGHITFKNCNSDAIIVAKSGNAVGFIAHAMTATSEATVTLENSNYTGTMSCSSCKYICGNWINATITDDQSSTKNNVIYKTSDNGWKYIEEGKTGSFTVKTGTLPSNIGDVFELDAESGATKAIISLVISPNPGCFTSTYMTEEVNVVDGKFTSVNVKYFTIRINANGVTEEGVHGNYYDVVNSIYNGTLGANTTVRFTQYNAAGGIISITNFSFNDK